jgi:MFS family permease
VELGGRRGGLAAGICNTGGNAGGLVAPVLTPFVAGRFGWEAAIGVGSAVCLAGVLLWRWIDPHERVPED